MTFSVYHRYFVSLIISYSLNFKYAMELNLFQYEVAWGNLQIYAEHFASPAVANILSLDWHINISI